MPICGRKGVYPRVTFCHASGGNHPSQSRDSPLVTHIPSTILTHALRLPHARYPHVYDRPLFFLSATLSSAPVEPAGSTVDLSGSGQHLLSRTARPTSYGLSIRRIASHTAVDCVRCLECSRRFLKDRFRPLVLAAGVRRATSPPVDLLFAAATYSMRQTIIWSRRYVPV